MTLRNRFEREKGFDKGMLDIDQTFYTTEYIEWLEQRVEKFENKEKEEEWEDWISYDKSYGYYNDDFVRREREKFEEWWAKNNKL